MNHLDPRIL